MILQLQPDPSADPDVRVHVVLKRNPSARKSPKQSGEIAEPSMESHQNNEAQNLREPIQVESKSQFLPNAQEKSEPVETSEKDPATPVIPLEKEAETVAVIKSDIKRRFSGKSYFDSDDEPLDDFTYDESSF